MFFMFAWVSFRYITKIYTLAYVCLRVGVCVVGDVYTVGEIII